MPTLHSTVFIQEGRESAPSRDLRRNMKEKAELLRKPQVSGLLLTYSPFIAMFITSMPPTCIHTQISYYICNNLEPLSLFTAMSITSKPPTYTRKYITYAIIKTERKERIRVTGVYSKLGLHEILSVGIKIKRQKTTTQH